MPKAGQPTAYKTDYCSQAHNYCLMGATNEDLAGFFEVTRRTIDNWIAAHPDFAAAVRTGRVVADSRVARSLYDRAMGFEHTVERTVMHRGEERTLKSTLFYPPDTQACIFWLRNRRRPTWNARAASNDDPGSADGYDALAELDAAGERAYQERLRALKSDGT